MPSAEIVGILLAAGNSSRFGSNKLLYPLPDGVPVVVAAARSLHNAVAEVVAVVRPEDQQLQKIMQGIGVRCVENPVAITGMGSSLATGVNATSEAAGWLIALADMPWIQPATMRLFAGRLSKGASIVAPVYDGRRGHPVGFSACWKDQLAGLSGDQGARELLKQQIGQLELVPTEDQGVLQDIDIPSDLQ